MHATLDGTCDIFATINLGTRLILLKKKKRKKEQIFPLNVDLLRNSLKKCCNLSIVDYAVQGGM